MRVKGKTDDMDIAHTYPAGYGTKFPVLGLYPDYNNTIVITEGSSTTSFNYTTAALESGVGNATVITDNLGEADPFNQDLYWASYARTDGSSIIAYDRKGDIRYFYQYSSVYPYKVSINNFTIQIEAGVGIMSVIGESIFIPSSSYSYHHDAIKLNNGNYVYLAFSTWGFEDRVIEETASGTIVKDVTFGSLFRDIVNAQSDNDTKTSDLEKLNQIIYDDSNPRMVDEEEVSTDWAHANSLVYDESTDIMYFSIRHQGVIAVNYTDWTLKWFMVDDDIVTIYTGSDNTYYLKDVVSLEPYRVGSDGETDGPQWQHALFLHSDNKLGMFDNRGGINGGSRYVEYSISGNNGSYTAVVSKKYEDTSLTARAMSDIDFTGDDNLLMGWGSTSQYRVREIKGSTIGTSGTGTVLFDMSVDSDFYRMDKMPLYPYQDESKKYSMDYNEKTGK